MAFIHFFLINWLPVSYLIILMMTSSLMIGILDNIFYKTPFIKDEIMRSVIGFAGIIILIEPDLFYTNNNIIEPNLAYVIGWQKALGVFIYFISMTLWSYSVILCRRLKELDTITVTFPWGILLVVYACIGQILLEKSKAATFSDYLLTIVFSGVFSFMDSLLFIRASQIGKAGRTAILFCLEPLYIFVFEIFYLHETHNPLSYFGAFLVILSALHLALYKK